MSRSVSRQGPSSRRGSSGPTIQVSDQHGGEDNPVFIFDDDHFNDVALSPFDARGSSRLSFRRASYDPSATSLLTVPSAGRRRHSLALSQTQDLPSSLQRPLADMTNIGRRRHSLASSHSQDLPTSLQHPLAEGDGRRGSVSIDQLYMPQVPTLYPPPRSPGRFSVQSHWSELIRLSDRKDSIGSYHSYHSYHSITSEQSLRRMSGISSAISSRILDLVHRFNSRTEYFKEKTIQPPTPTSEETKSVLSASTADGAGITRQHRLASYIPPVSRASAASSILLNPEGYYLGTGKCRFKMPKFLRRFDVRRTIDPTSAMYTAWLLLVTFTYIYNAAAVPLRAAFTTAEFAEPEQVQELRTVEVCDYVYENMTTQPPTVSSGPGTPTEGTGLGMMNITCYNKTVPTTVFKTKYLWGYETDDNRFYWWILDYTADLIYILDIILVKIRVRFVKNGLMEFPRIQKAMRETNERQQIQAIKQYSLNSKDRKECYRKYTSSLNFRMDVASLTPLDVFYLLPQVQYNTLLRLPRLLKIQTFWECYDRLDASVKNAHIIRVMRTLTYMLFLIHVETCGYFAVSSYEGIGFNEWVYSGKGRAYVRCIYLATKTATSIGNNPKPTNKLEYIFMTVYWLSGVFVFAMLIGQIRDIFQAANAAKTNFRDTMDKTLGYLKSMNVPKDLQDKVRLWFNYNWKNQKTLNENLLLEALPSKMKADMAIHVHFEILSKVQLFQDCDKALLFDLVLKLNPVLYLPGDYICLKGEVGTEMYIVMSGQVEVVGGEHNNLVFATLNEGSVFGEISLLAVGGGNRRTANVRSKGYSQLFILSKADFEEAMTDYPEAQKLLKRKAKKLLNKNKKVEEESKIETQEIIRSRESTPKMLKTVVEIIKPQSKIHDYFKTSRKSLFDRTETMDTSHLDEHSDEEDEILVVEQIERPVSEEELKRYADRDTSSPKLTAPDKVGHPVMSPISEDSISAQVEAILQPTPPPHSKHTKGVEQSTLTQDSIRSKDESNPPPDSKDSEQQISMNNLKHSFEIEQGNDEVGLVTDDRSNAVVVNIEIDDEDDDDDFKVNKGKKDIKIPSLISHKGFKHGKVAPIDGPLPKQSDISQKKLPKSNLHSPKLPSIAVLNPAALENNSSNDGSLHKSVQSHDGKVIKSTGPIGATRLIKSNKVGIANPDDNKSDVILKSDSVTAGNNPASASSFGSGTSSSVFTVSQGNIVECNVEVHREKSRTPSQSSIQLGFINHSYDV